MQLSISVLDTVSVADQLARLADLAAGASLVRHLAACQFGGTLCADCKVTTDNSMVCKRGSEMLC